MAKSRLGRALGAGVALLIASAAGAVVAPAAAKAEVTMPNSLVGGYRIVTPLVTKVEAAWRVPDIDCSNNNQNIDSDARFWVGIGHLTGPHTTMAKLGILTNCVAGRKVYGAFLQMARVSTYANDAAMITQPVRQRDMMRATIEHLADRAFAFTLKNLTRSWTFTATASFDPGVNPSLSGAAAVVETPLYLDGAQVYAERLTKFGIDLPDGADRFAFSGFRVNDVPAGADVYNDDRIRSHLIIGPPDHRELVTAGDMGASGSFTVRYRMRGPKRYFDVHAHA